MKTFLSVIGGIVLLFFVALIGFFIYGFIKLGPITAEAEEYASETLLAVISHWNGDAIHERATPELNNVLEEGSVLELMGQGARAVGDLTSLGDVECTANFNTSTEKGTVYTANCSSTAKHARGNVDYTLTIIKRDDLWALNAFNFNVSEITPSSKDI